MLADTLIKGRILTEGIVTGINDIEEQVQPTSIDLRMDNEVIYPPNEEEYEFEGKLEIKPGEFLLASTVEEVMVPEDLNIHVRGRSSFAREGLQIHCAGHAEVGFQGNLTLELKNLIDERYVPDGLDPSIYVEPYERICQIVFEPVTGGVEQSYKHKEGAKYSGQSGVTPSRRGGE